nr:xylulose kinase-1 [Tanacetum cinerariifolium]
NGNSKKSLGRDSKREIIILSPVSFEEHVAVQRETKARTLLLQSLPEDHMANFHHLDDAREIWLAMKARFGGTEESKKMRKTMLKQAFSNCGRVDITSLDQSRANKYRLALASRHVLEIGPTCHVSKWDPLADVAANVAGQQSMLTVNRSTLIGSESVFNTWMAFEGNTHDLGSFGEETDKTIALHEVSRRTMHTARGDGVASIKRWRHDFQSDGIKDFVMKSEHSHL